VVQSDPIILKLNNVNISLVNAADLLQALARILPINASDIHISSISSSSRRRSTGVVITFTLTCSAAQLAAASSALQAAVGNGQLTSVLREINYSAYANATAVLVYFPTVASATSPLASTLLPVTTTPAPRPVSTATSETYPILFYGLALLIVVLTVFIRSRTIWAQQEEEDAMEAVRRLIPGYAGAFSSERPAVQVGNFLSAPVEEVQQLADETITSTTNNPFIGGPETPTASETMITADQAAEIESYFHNFQETKVRPPPSRNQVGQSPPQPLPSRGATQSRAWALVTPQPSQSGQPSTLRPLRRLAVSPPSQLPPLALPQQPFTQVSPPAHLPPLAVPRHPFAVSPPTQLPPLSLPTKQPK